MGCFKLSDQADGFGEVSGAALVFLGSELKVKKLEVCLEHSQRQVRN